ncbi:mediator of RNA polymerase II transcription subunit 15 [Drosophila santomea]|nr:mediator of RNA polymerase II transcription subunit 15 [Drosophila santomea]
MQVGILSAFVALLAIFLVRPSEGILDITNQINSLISAPILPAIDSLLRVYGGAESKDDGGKVSEQRESIAEDNTDYSFNLESKLKFKLPTVNLQIILDKDQPEPKSNGDAKYLIVDRFTNRLYNPGITLRELLQNFTPSQIRQLRSVETSRTEMRDLYMKLLRNALGQSKIPSLSHKQQLARWQLQVQSQARGQSYEQFARTTDEEQIQGLAQSQQQSELKQSLNQSGAKLQEDEDQEDQDVTSQAQAQKSERQYQLTQSTQSEIQGQSQSQVQAQSRAMAIGQLPQESEDTAEDQEQAESQDQAESQVQAQTQVQSQAQEQESLVQAGDQAKEDPIDQSLHQAQAEVLKQVLSQTNTQSQAQAQAQAQVLDQALEEAHVQYQSHVQLQGIAQSQSAQQSLLEAQGQAREDPVDQSLHQAQAEVLKQVLSQTSTQSRAQAQAQAQALDQTLEQAHVQYQSVAQAQGTTLPQPPQQPQLQAEDQAQDTASDEVQPHVELADQSEKQDQIANQAFDQAEGQLQRQSLSESQSQSEAQLQAVDKSLHLAQAQVEEQKPSGAQSQSNGQALAVNQALGEAHALLQQSFQSQSKAQGLAVSLSQSPQQLQLQADDQSSEQARDLAQDSVVDQSLHQAQAEIQDQLDSQSQASGQPLAPSQQQAQAQTVEALTQSLTQAHAQIQEQDQSQSQGLAESQTSSNSQVLFQGEGRSQSQSLQGPKSDVVSYLGIQARYQYISEADIQIVAKLETPKLILRYGHQVETHYAFTADGYKLCLHRIPRPGAIPVMLVHGLMASSASWVQFGPSQGLAYILSQAGYDVWMLNTRGNIYSEERQTGREKDQDFWDFSFHEIGQYDLPAAIDLILLQTKMPRIQYIGHSQGSTAFFVMCSERPEYAAKISLMQSLSPSVYMEGTRSPALKFIGILQGGFTMLLNLLGGHKISLDNKIINMFREHICDKLIPSRICAIFEFVVCGFNFNSFNMTLSPILEGHASQGASAKQIYHFAQMQGKSVFQKFDYGLILNKLRYNSILPPLYNLSLALSKVALHRGDGDWLGSESDALRLERSLPNCIENRNIRFQGFSHFDFTISKDVRPLVYDRVVNLCGSNR